MEEQEQGLHSAVTGVGIAGGCICSRSRRLSCVVPQSNTPTSTTTVVIPMLILILSRLALQLRLLFQV